MTIDHAAARAEQEEEVAQEYAQAIYSGATDWPERNQAIIDRWSRTALLRIKERAWQIVEIGR